MNKTNINWNAVSSLAAVVAVLISIIFSLINTHQVKEGLIAQNIAHLEITLRLNDAEPRKGLVLRNDGNGVAFIKSMRVSYGDPSLSMTNTSKDFSVIYDTVPGIFNNNYYQSQYLAQGNALKPEREFWLLEKTGILDGDSIVKIYQCREICEINNLNEIYIEIEYENVFKKPGYLLFNSGREVHNSYENEK